MKFTYFLPQLFSLNAQKVRSDGGVAEEERHANYLQRVVRFRSYDDNESVQHRHPLH